MKKKLTKQIHLQERLLEPTNNLDKSFDEVNGEGDGDAEPPTEKEKGDDDETSGNFFQLQLSSDDEGWSAEWKVRPKFTTAKQIADENEKTLRKYNAIYVPKLGIVMQEEGSGKYTHYEVDSVANREQVRIETRSSDDENEGDEDREAPIFDNYFAVDDTHGDHGDSRRKSRFLPFKILRFCCGLVNWYNMSCLGKCIFVSAGWYCDLVRNLTIPKTEKEDWNKGFTTCALFLGSIFFLVQLYSLFDAFSKWSWWLLAPWIFMCLVGAILGVFVHFTASSKKQPIYMPVIVIFTFFVCMAWIFFLADTLVKFIEAVGATMRLPSSVLGLTILAWGNATGDAAANIMIARSGFPNMAVSAVFGTGLLNCLIGLGCAFTYDTIKNFIASSEKHFYRSFCFEINPDGSLAFAFMFLIISLATSLCCVPIMRFRARRPLAIFLGLIYLLYVILASLATLVPPIKEGMKQVRFHNSKC